MRNYVLMLVFIGIVAATCDDPADLTQAILSTDDVTPDQLPTVDSTRVFKYRFATVNVDSIVHSLNSAGIELFEAWVPLQDVCADAIGPRFTILLPRAGDKEALDRLDFVPGTGIRACTTRVRRIIFKPR